MTRRAITLIGCFATLALAACASPPRPPPADGTEGPPQSNSEEIQTPMPSEPQTPAPPDGQVAPGTEVQVTGTVAYRERVALTPEAVVQVEVVELGPDGSTGPAIGEQILRNPGQVPIHFSVAIPSERIRPEATYVARALITDAGRRFSTPAPVPVITQGNPSSDVRILVRSGG